MSDWVLVTGGATRLGREISLAFAKAGWNLICHYRNSEEKAQSLCQEVTSFGVFAQALYAELENEDSCLGLYKQASEVSNHRLACIVNSASLFIPDNAHDFEEHQALQQLSVNLMAPMRFGKWLYESRLNKATNSGLDATTGSSVPKHSPSIVHILDQKVFNLNPDYFTYTVSKLALERIVSLQAQSFGPSLRVNAVSPGLIYPSGPQDLENFKIASNANLMGIPIDPKQVAQSVLFLAQNPCITGTTIKVDNGQHLVPTPRDIMFVVDQLKQNNK